MNVHAPFCASRFFYSPSESVWLHRFMPNCRCIESVHALRESVSEQDRQTQLVYLYARPHQVSCSDELAS